VGGLVTRYNLPTTNLGPERVKEFETGMDLGLIKDKADFGVTYYRQHSTGVILNIPVAGSTGYTEEPANAASLRNYGWELALNVRPVTTKEFLLGSRGAVGGQQEPGDGSGGRAVRALPVQRRLQRPRRAGCGDPGRADRRPLRQRLRALRSQPDHQ